MGEKTYAQVIILELVDKKKVIGESEQFWDYEEYYNDYSDYFDSGYYEQPD